MVDQFSALMEQHKPSFTDVKWHEENVPLSTVYMPLVVRLGQNIKKLELKYVTATSDMLETLALHCHNLSTLIEQSFGDDDKATRYAMCQLIRSNTGLTELHVCSATAASVLDDPAVCPQLSKLYVEEKSEPSMVIRSTSLQQLKVKGRLIKMLGIEMECPNLTSLALLGLKNVDHLLTPGTLTNHSNHQHHNQHQHQHHSLVHTRNSLHQAFPTSSP